MKLNESITRLFTAGKPDKELTNAVSFLETILHRNRSFRFDTLNGQRVNSLKGLLSA